MAAHRDALIAVVDEVAGAVDLMVGPWPGDGHPDHAAVGEACRVACDGAGTALLEYPVWMWHWSTPLTPGSTANSSPCPHAALRVAKRRAIAAHRSQTEPVTGAPVLADHVLAHFEREVEVYIDHREPVGPNRRRPPRRSSTRCMPPHPDTTRGTSGATPPSGCGTRRYRQARRPALSKLLRARMLDRRADVDAVVVLCAHVTAMDCSAHAIAEAQASHPALVGVESGRQVPEDIPTAEGPYDLIVLSELGYYFDVEALRRLVVRLREVWADDGRLMAVHWTGTLDHVLPPGRPTT